VELLIDIDNGDVSIGTKRQRMIEKAKGEYLCFIDDDDLVTDNYVATLLEAMKSNPDCVGFKAKFSLFGNDDISGDCIYSIRFQEWKTRPNNIFERTPGHLTPVKTELALRVGYKDLNWQEDKDFSERLQPLLKTEEFVDQYLYSYLFRITAQRKGEITHKLRTGAA
jgi:hypothetical protein